MYRYKGFKNIIRLTSILLFIIILILIYPQNSTGSTLDSAPPGYIATIYTTDVTYNQLYQGTGFIVDPGGVIATNFHVVLSKYRNKESPLLVVLEKGVFFGNILSVDPNYDIALLKIDANELQTIGIDESYNFKKGQNIRTIRNITGLDKGFFMSQGHIKDVFGRNELIQFDASVSYGNSGSPLLNEEGLAIGIVTFIIDNSKDANFALPIKYVIRLLKETKKINPKPF